MIGVLHVFTLLWVAKNLSVFGLLYISTLQSKFRRQRHHGIFPNFPEGKTLSSCEVSPILFSLNINMINIFVDKRYFLDLDVSNLKAVKRWVISRSNIVIDTAMFICVSTRYTSSHWHSGVSKCFDVWATWIWSY